MEGGRVVQVGTPEEILQHPANDYVAAFFRGVDPTTILSAGDIARDSQVTLIRHPGDGPRAGLQRLISHDRDHGYVLDAEKHLLGVVSTESLRKFIDETPDEKDISRAFIPEAQPGRADDSMQDILPFVAERAWPIPIVDENNVYRGVISKNVFLRTLQHNHHEKTDELEA